MYTSGRQQKVGGTLDYDDDDTSGRQQKVSQSNRTQHYYVLQLLSTVTPLNTNLLRNPLTLTKGAMTRPHRSTSDSQNPLPALTLTSAGLYHTMPHQRPTTTPGGGRVPEVSSSSSPSRIRGTALSGRAFDPSATHSLDPLGTQVGCSNHE